MSWCTHINTHVYWYINTHILIYVGMHACIMTSAHRLVHTLGHMGAGVHPISPAPFTNAKAEEDVPNLQWLS